MKDSEAKQIEANETITDRHFTGIVGAAGAGKATAVKAIVEQYKAAGYAVIGVAPSAAAAHELKSAGCDDTRTFASALIMQQKEEDAGKKKIFIMDGNGMAAKDMDAFLQKAGEEGACTILMGDPRQLAAVESGSTEEAERDRIQRLVDTNGRCWEILHQAGEHEAADKHFLHPGACGEV
jgi:ATP-dependent exoDNAse (exonuclease V) alpha subunit